MLIDNIKIIIKWRNLLVFKCIFYVFDIVKKIMYDIMCMMYGYFIFFLYKYKNNEIYY